jgi:predicted membrane GTPase involved in stress response
VLRKALEARLPVILVVNKVDRPDARIAEVVNAVYKLFLDLDADESQIEFPIVYCNARAGHACLDPHTLDDDLAPLLDFVVEHIPAPEHEEGPPCRRSSRTWTRRRMSAASRSAGSSTARSDARSRSPGAAPTGRSSARR